MAMLTVLVAIVLGIFFVLVEILDWIGRLEIIEQRWPKIFTVLNSRFARLAAILILIVLIAHDIEQRAAIPEPPRVTFLPAPVPVINQSGTMAVRQPSAPAPCIHPIRNFRVNEIPAFSGANYVVKITIPAIKEIATGSSFQFYFGNNYVLLQGLTNSGGKTLLNTSVGTGGGVGSIVLGQAIPKGDALVVTASSTFLPVRVTCIDKLLVASQLKRP